MCFEFRDKTKQELLILKEHFRDSVLLNAAFFIGWIQIGLSVISFVKESTGETPLSIHIVVWVVGASIGIMMWNFAGKYRSCIKELLWLQSRKKR